MQVQPVTGPYLYNLPGTGISSTYVRPDFASVSCNCCSWTNITCARVLVFFNTAQVAFCYISLIIQVASPIAPTSYHYWNFPEPKSKDDGSFNWDIYVCAKKVTQTPISESRLSIQIVLLGIYFIGSVLLSVGVFMKSLGPRKRGLCLLFYLATIACLPLAYLIPVFIDLTICSAKAVFLTLLVYHHWLYLSVLFTTWLGIHIGIALRKWVMRDPSPSAIVPQSQQQIKEPRNEDWEDSFNMDTSESN